MDNKEIKKGEVWLVNYEPSRRGELGKTARPSIVVQSNEGCTLLDTITVVPTSTKVEQYDEIYIYLKPTKQSGLNKPSAAICSHVYTVSKNNFIKKIGILNEQDFSSVKKGMALHLDIEL
ncbi:MAG: type II toxin-antitoxin system PemK/MazF family toxin [Candidatus Melainabacteria bacterium]|nr:type II toxin-antitoxin system PemK/MazF family toxin [Candidatus Melainabacteria bacterium]